ncbi:hypothetical protein ACVWZL_001323 [Bradyrhizobium sp. GM2.4]
MDVSNPEKQAKISEYLATSTPTDLITGPIVSIINKETTMTTISIVTGGTRGLGRNTALSIGRHGGDVILTYRSGAAEAETTIQEMKALGRKAVALPLDVSKASSFKTFANEVQATWALLRGSRARHFLS